MSKFKEVLAKKLKEIMNFLFIVFFLVGLGGVFYYFRVQKLHVFTGEWHWNLFEYYGINYDIKHMIVVGVLFIIIMFLVIRTKR